MVDVQQIMKIDLAEYGMQGEIILSNPSLRKTIEMKNALGNCTKTHLVDGKPVIDETRLGDVDIIMMMAYVKSAPFKADLKGFLSYCDVLDNKEMGSAQRLYDTLSTMTEAFRNGAKSPFVNSQEQATENSA